MKKYKILFYINTLEFGGAERVISIIANGFYQRGYEVVFVTTFPTNQEYCLNAGIKRQYLEQNRNYGKVLIRNIGRIVKLRRIIKEEKSAFIISFMAEANFRSILATLFLKTKTIISIRNDPRKEYGSKFTFALAQILFCFSDRCIFQTKDALYSFNRLIRKKGQIILNPVAEGFFTEHKNTGKDIISVGRLESQKNHELLINAFSEISINFPNTALKIFGKGSKQQSLLHLIEKLDMKEKIILMGNSDNMPHELENAKIFVLSSDYEGLPNALMEAIAMGLPVISTNCPCGGPQMLIEDGKNGYLVDVNSLPQMIDTLYKLLNDTIAQKKFSEENLIVREKFRLSHILTEWENVMLSLGEKR